MGLRVGHRRNGEGDAGYVVQQGGGGIGGCGLCMAAKIYIPLELLAGEDPARTDTTQVLSSERLKRVRGIQGPDELQREEKAGEEAPTTQGGE